MRFDKIRFIIHAVAAPGR